MSFRTIGAYVIGVTRMKNSPVNAVVGTLLLYNAQHRASAVPAAAVAAHPAASAAALAEVRDFLLAQLDTHHKSEDDILWPLIEERVPEAAEPLARLSGSTTSWR
jgi:hypothetical protein